MPQIGVGLAVPAFWPCLDMFPSSALGQLLSALFVMPAPHQLVAAADDLSPFDTEVVALQRLGGNGRYMTQLALMFLSYPWLRSIVERMMAWLPLRSTLVGTSVFYLCAEFAILGDGRLFASIPLRQALLAALATLSTLSTLSLFASILLRQALLAALATLSTLSTLATRIIKTALTFLRSISLRAADAQATFAVSFILGGYATEHVSVGPKLESRLRVYADVIFPIYMLLRCLFAMTNEGPTGFAEELSSILFGAPLLWALFIFAVVRLPHTHAHRLLSSSAAIAADEFVLSLYLTHWSVHQLSWASTGRCWPVTNATLAIQMPSAGCDASTNFGYFSIFAAMISVAVATHWLAAWLGHKLNHLVSAKYLTRVLI